MQGKHLEKETDSRNPVEAYRSKCGTIESCLEVLVKPCHGLAKRLLLGKLLSTLGQVTANRKPMLHIGEQADLIRNIKTIQDLLTFVPLHRCEHKVSHCDETLVADNYTMSRYT